jgi:alginate O-acetyltransferase complex protein AlgI
MLFNSYEFILLFLPITFFVYFWLNHNRLVIAGKSWLVLMSFVFYGWWNTAYLPLILSTIMVNYAVGTALAKNNSHSRSDVAQQQLSRRIILAGGIVFNIGLLGYFKYADFFVENLMALGGGFTLLGVVLPLAISFITFQQIAYLVDCYRGHVREQNLLNYTLFITFFPQLIAGPIVHHKEMMPQFVGKRQRIRNYQNIAVGLFIFSIGLFKKVMLADTFALWADAGFAAPETLGLYEAWVTSLSYTFQIYFDFSGYTDMAIGAALLFNIRLPLNFNSPYKAASIQDFWHRWHMTLSRFLRDYLYIPLGGSRKGRGRTYLNIFATFLIGGLWHGASWMFVIWGALHGMALIVHRLWQNAGGRMPLALGVFLTFNFVNITWVFFRADSVENALHILKAMFDISQIAPPSVSPYTLLCLVCGALVVFTMRNAEQCSRQFKPTWFYLAWMLAASGALFMLSNDSPFLYFDF